MHSISGDMEREKILELNQATVNRVIKRNSENDSISIT